MTPKERIEKLDQLFDHTVKLAMQHTGPEGMLNYAKTLQMIDWLIRVDSGRMEDEHVRTD